MQRQDPTGSPVRRRRASLRFKTPASVLVDEDEVKAQEDSRHEDRGTRSLLSVRRDQMWQSTMQDLSPDSRELFDDLEEAELEHTSASRRGSGSSSSRRGGHHRHQLHHEHQEQFSRHVPFHLFTPRDRVNAEKFGQDEDADGDVNLHDAFEDVVDDDNDADMSIHDVSAIDLTGNVAESGLQWSSTSSTMNDASTEGKTEQELLDESERLARQLMAEEEDQLLERLHQVQLEAMRNMHRTGSDVAQANASEATGGAESATSGAAASEEDESVALALRLMAEEEAEADRVRVAMEEAARGADFDPDDMSYDELVELGERIGNVKQERWRVDGRALVEALPVVVFKAASHDEGALQGVDTTKCLVCQYPYEEDEELKVMPCKHAFHKDCIDPWLVDHDTCVACKQSLRDTADP
ncbi:E3 ubiquitin-protein ligase MBR1 [Hondaea fermentalgiana]|uniref:E3 ubiquitin-protein ligase MBR1 n=1 Tax=Hondaea fermentalgiana TaxID=2315210 RepID=A0A2R5G1K9_9STRA|nr:E3 ubiquitin-protein ligase MBR1 [Hondaea fermentalgiana]|eukprot:GBG24189.1 E3 ubiquitin-protein ligase MBR1 [Hondaea fermentalgiana]